MTDQVLHLVVPGLRGPMPRLEGTAAGRRFPGIERWLARADRFAVPADAEALLFQLFGVPLPEQGDLPTAPVCYLADTGQVPEGFVYHATPVHLCPDQDRLLLFDTPTGDLDAGQAADFVAAFNDHFTGDGWRLSAPTPARWYLHVAGHPRLRTRPLGDVIGRNVDLFRPEGVDAGRWQQRLNEVQMLFHGLPVNAAREAAGQLLVNGVWLHGGGTLPTAGRHRPLVETPATPLLDGLASLGGEPSGDRLRWLGEPRRAVWDADPSAWLTALAQVEALLASLSGSVCLYPGDGHGYRYTAARRWRMWRRPRPLLGSLLPELDD